MPRRSDEDIFLSLVPTDGTSIGNMSLRDQLGWDEDKYSRVRDRLREQDKIYLGKGRGGSVRLVQGDKRALLKLVPKDGASASNIKLIEQLGWDEDLYRKVKDWLVEDNKLVEGRGDTIRRSQRPLTLEEEEQTLFGLLPITSIPKLLEHLGWNEDRYWEVRARLIQKGLIDRDHGITSPTPQGQMQKNQEGSSLDLDEQTMLALVPKDGSSISNRKLLAQLGWNKDRYWTAHDELIKKRKIIAGVGQGGTIRLPELKAPKTGPSNIKITQRKAPGPINRDIPVDVFVAYSHQDEELRDKLATHLRFLEKIGLISSWYDRKITAGAEWKQEIDNRLGRARLILLLVSSDFLASDYCHDIEMKRAMERHDTEDAVVIPIILRQCQWRLSPFAKLQALPKDAKPVVQWLDKDEAFHDISEGICLAVKKLRIAL